MPYPTFAEANQAARSMPPAPDGSRPGVFMFPRRVEWMTTYRLRTLTYHEAVPGHGQLDLELFRARRLVVDTGIHAMHWTRQQAIDYGIEPSEVDRYVVNPGQACSYMIGQLKILELRERAKRELGERFSLKQFHNVVFDTGTVPLDLLEGAIDQYIGGAAYGTATARTEVRNGAR